MRFFLIFILLFLSLVVLGQEKVIVTDFKILNHDTIFIFDISEVKNIDEKVYALYPTVGENLYYLELNQLNNIQFLYREIDQFSWQFCNKGFFNFKNYIPKIVTKFN